MTTVTEQGTGGLAAREMPLIHRIFRREFRSLQRVVHDLPPSAGQRARAVADHLQFVLDGLHHHHHNEDEMVWPLLKERVGMDAPMVARMEQQHGQIAQAVSGIRGAGAAWAEQPTTATATVLTDGLSALLSVLEAHLDEEERVVVPLIDEYLTREEWEAMGRKGFEKFAPKERPIAMGQLLEVATADEARLMFADLPLPVRILWRVAGKRQYRRHVERVRGKPLNPLMRRGFKAANPMMVRNYQRSQGRRGSQAKGLPMLLITVRGRRTGTEHTTPVVYFAFGGSYLVCGSPGGRRSSRSGSATFVGSTAPRSRSARKLTPSQYGCRIESSGTGFGRRCSIGRRSSRSTSRRRAG